MRATCWILAGAVACSTLVLKDEPEHIEQKTDYPQPVEMIGQIIVSTSTATATIGIPFIGGLPAPVRGPW
jgi:hypothetical protein